MGIEHEIELQSGIMLDTTSQNPVCTMSDIAYGLARTCRFHGQIRKDIDIYTVAQHSVILYDYIKRITNFDKYHPFFEDGEGGYYDVLKFMRTALLHDAPEGPYIDLARPVKHHNPQYEDMEGTLWEYIATKWDLYSLIPSAIKKLDYQLLAAEREQVMSHTDNVWEYQMKGVVPLDVTVYCLSIRQSYRAFAFRLHEMGITDVSINFGE